MSPPSKDRQATLENVLGEAEFQDWSDWAPTHFASTTSRNNDVHRSDLVNHGVWSGFSGHLTQFRHRVSCDLLADVVFRHRSRA